MGTSVVAGATVAGEVIVLTPEELGAAMEYKYPTQTVEVAGTIHSIGYISPELSMIFLNIARGRGGISSCVVQESQAWSRFAPGQEVTLRGRAAKVSPYIGFAYQVVKAGPNPAPILKAEDFAGEFAKDDSIARAKYRDRSFYLIGKVVSFERKPDDESTVTLQGQPDLPMTLKMDDSFNLIGGSLAAGKIITAMCTPSVGWSYDSGLNMNAVAITVPMPVPNVVYPAQVPSAADLNSPIAKAMREAKPDFQATVEELRTEYQQDSKAFDSKYKLKVIEVTGPMMHFSTDNESDYITLEDTAKFRGFACVLAESFPFDKVAPRQPVTVRARFDESVAVKLIDGIVVAISPLEPATRQLSADELVKACLQAGDAFATDWEKSIVEVTGKVGSASIEEYSAAIELAGADKSIVRVSMSPDYGRRAKIDQLKAGQEIRLRGEIWKFDAESKEVDLLIGWIVKDAK